MTLTRAVTYAQAAESAELARGRQEKIGFCSGCFDLFHAGHVEFLEDCAERCGFLVVSVGNDETVRALKGAERPVVSGEHRARIVAALHCIDVAVLSTERGIMDHTELVKAVRPDVYFLPVPCDGAIWQRKKELVTRGYVGRMESVQYEPRLDSTTAIVGRMAA